MQRSSHPVWPLLCFLIQKLLPTTVSCRSLPLDASRHLTSTACSLQSSFLIKPPGALNIPAPQSRDPSQSGLINTENTKEETNGPGPALFLKIQLTVGYCQWILVLRIMCCCHIWSLQTLISLSLENLEYVRVFFWVESWIKSDRRRKQIAAFLNNFF